MTTRFYFRATTTEPTTDANEAIYDLLDVIGDDDPLGTLPNENDWETTARWRNHLDGADIIGDVPTSLNITAIQGDTEYRWRINRLDGAGNIAASSDWSPILSATGVQTHTFTAPNAEPYDFIEIEFQSQRAGGMPDNNSVTVAVSLSSLRLRPAAVRRR